jgi:MFS family permease
MRTQIAEGMRYVWHHRLLRPIALCTATSNLFSSMWAATVVLFMVRTLHLKAGVIGLVFAAANVGFLLGAALVGRVTRWVSLGRIIVLSIGLGSPLSILVPLAPRSSPLPYLIAGQFLFAVTTPLYNIPQVSLRQAICPDRLLGRMNATMRFIVWGTMPIGAVIGGFLGGIIGLRTTLFVAVGGMSLAFLFPLLSPVWRLRDVPEPDADPLDGAAVGGAGGATPLVPGVYPPPVA